MVRRWTDLAQVNMHPNLLMILSARGTLRTVHSAAWELQCTIAIGRRAWHVSIEWLNEHSSSPEASCPFRTEHQVPQRPWTFVWVHLFPIPNAPIRLLWLGSRFFLFGHPVSVMSEAVICDLCESQIYPHLKWFTGSCRFVLQWVSLDQSFLCTHLGMALRICLVQYMLCLFSRGWGNLCSAPLLKGGREGDMDSFKPCSPSLFCGL